MALPSDDAKFRMLFDSYHQAVQGYCARRLDPDRANDAVAEVYLVAWRRLGDVPDAGEALPWLYGVARNVVRNFYRSHQRHRALVTRVAMSDPPDEPGPAAQVVRREEDEQIAAALERLREPDREVVRLRLWEDLTYAEIGDVLGITPKAAGMRYQRALHRLARTLRRVERRPVASGVDRAMGGES